MIWFLIIVVVLIAAFAVPRFGAALLVLVAIAAIAVLSELERENADNRESLTRVPKDQLELTNLELGRVPGGEGDYQIFGQAKNNSAQYTVNEVDIRVKVFDCPAKRWSRDCATIGDSDVVILADIPPGQLRAVQEDIFFDSMPPIKGSLVWSYKIAKIRAQ